MIGRRLVYFTGFHSYLLVKKLKFKIITSLSKPNTRIGGAYFSAPAHGVNTSDSLYNPSLNGGLYKLFSLVVALIKAEK